MNSRWKDSMDPQGIIEELNFGSQVALNGIWGCISPETGQKINSEKTLLAR